MFEQKVILVPLLLTLNRLICCFHCWFETCKCRLGISFFILLMFIIRTYFRKKGTFFHATLVLIYETPKIEDDYVLYVYYCIILFISFRSNHEQHCTTIHYQTPKMLFYWFKGKLQIWKRRFWLWYIQV